MWLLRSGGEAVPACRDRSVPFGLAPIIVWAKTQGALDDSRPWANLYNRFAVKIGTMPVCSNPIYRVGRETA